MDASFAYRRTDGNSASPVRLVILLYEQLIKDLQRALAAMDRNDVAARTNELGHAQRVVGQLQATLDMKQGGEVARNLDSFYHSLRACLLQAQIQISPKILRKQIATLLDVREAWVQVERQAQANSAPRASSVAAASTADGEKTLQWSI